MDKSLPDALSLALEPHNHTEIAISFPPAGKRPEPAFKRISITQLSLTLLAVSAHIISAELFIDVPYSDLEIDEGVTSARSA